MSSSCSDPSDTGCIAKYRYCMAQNPNSGRFMTGSIGTLLDGTNAGNVTKLSGSFRYGDIPTMQPRFIRNICSEWAGCCSVPLLDPDDIQKSDPRRPPIVTRNRLDSPFYTKQSEYFGANPSLAHFIGVRSDLDLNPES